MESSVAIFHEERERGVCLHSSPFKKTLAIPESVPLGHNMCSKINRFLTEKAAPLRQDATPSNNYFFRVWEKLISSLFRTKMAPWDQLSTKERNMASSQEGIVVRINA